MSQGLQLGKSKDYLENNVIYFVRTGYVNIWVVMRKGGKMLPAVAFMR